MRDALEQIPLPDAGAQERAREIVLAAFEAREAVRRPRRGRTIAIGVAAATAAIALAAASPPGMAVVDRVREVVGVERASPALFSLPAPGRLLVASDAGVWVVGADGTRRLLEAYDEPSWSPFGRFLVAARPNELAALEPDGDVRWTLARPGVHAPRWTGTRRDTRIAYVDRTGVRVVAGDGTGDRLVAPGADAPLAWRPGAAHVLAYVAAHGVRVEDVDTERVLAHEIGLDPQLHTDLEWSTDGRRLLVVNDGELRVFRGRGGLVARSDPADGRVVDAAFRPGTHDVLVARTRRGQSTVAELGSSRAIFAGTGVFEAITPSSDGRWLAIEWRTADQWVFVHLERRRTIRAFSSIADQFGGGEAAIAGWCCSG